MKRERRADVAIAVLVLVAIVGDKEIMSLSKSNQRVLMVIDRLIGIYTFCCAKSFLGVFHFLREGKEKCFVITDPSKEGRCPRKRSITSEELV